MNKPPVKERRRLKRRNISYYLPIKDNQTGKPIGHLVDITTIGLLMDSKIPIQPGMEYSLQLDYMEVIAEKASVDLIARGIWNRPDAINPYLFNAGFEITSIAPEDVEIIKLISDKYGAG